MTPELRDTPKVPIQQTHNLLVVSLQIDLSDEVLQRFQRDLLESTQKLQPKGIILDISGLRLFDTYEFESLRRTMDMAQLMGCPSILVGIHPGIAAAIAEMDVDCDGLLTARSLEEAFEIVDQLSNCHQPTESSRNADRRVSFTDQGRA